MFEKFRLETRRTILRNLTIDDLEQFHRMLQSEAVMQYLPDPIPTRTQSKEILKWLISCYAKNRPDDIVKFTVGVEDKQSSRLIGWNGFGPLDFDPAEIEIYYGLTEEFWGKGVATETTAAMLRYGFETVGLERVVAVMMPDNIASAKVAENVGLKFRKIITGLDEEFAEYEGDRYYSLTRNEYRSGQ